MTKRTSYGSIKETTIGGIFMPRRKGTPNTPSNAEIWLAFGNQKKEISQLWRLSSQIS